MLLSSSPSRVLMLYPWGKYFITFNRYLTKCGLMEEKHPFRKETYTGTCTATCTPICSKLNMEYMYFVFVFQEEPWSDAS